MNALVRINFIWREPISSSSREAAGAWHQWRLQHAFIATGHCAQSAATPVFPSQPGNPREADLLLSRSRPGPRPDPTARPVLCLLQVSAESLFDRVFLALDGWVGSGRRLWQSAGHETGQWGFVTRVEGPRGMNYANPRRSRPVDLPHQKAQEDGPHQ